MNNNNFIYKDKSPITTIHIIKELLLKHNIDIDEKWYNEGSIFPSLRIKIKGTNLGTNGKGTNEAYARASAYAELLERIYNEAIIQKQSIHIKDNSNDNAYLLDFIKDNKNLLKLATRFDESVNFTSLLNHKNYCFSKQLIKFMYGTNGMYCGNSFEEGVSQGIFEILERYVLKLVLLGQVSGRLIKKNELSDANYTSIRFLEEKSNSKITLIDYSVDTKMPVCCLVLNNCKGYYVKFGSHAIMNIAIQRCITELMQGRNLSRLGTQNNLVSNFIYTELNYLHLIENGVGTYPLRMLFNISRNKTNFLSDNNFNKNVDVLKYLNKLINELKYEVLIKEYRIGDLNIGQVIIPSISEIYVNNIHEVEHFINKIDILESFNSNNAENFFGLIYNNFVSFDWELNNKKVYEFYGTELLSSKIGEININLFFALVSIYYDDYKRTIKYLRLYEIELKKNNYIIPIYYECMIYLCYAKLNKFYIDIGFLKNFFPEEICNECFSDFRQNAYLKEAFYLKNENIIKIFNALYEMIEDVPND